MIIAKENSLTRARIIAGFSIAELARIANVNHSMICRAADDPGTQMTLCSIRKIIRSGAVHVVPCGRKKLVDYDCFLAYLQSGQTAAPALVGGIRPLPERV